MARPKKSEETISMEAQIENAFWKLLYQKEINKIGVSEIIQAVHCNRSTFYYYYTDIHALAYVVIEKSIPEHIPHIAMLYLSGDIETVTFDAKAKESIEKICLLLNRSNSRSLIQLIENAIIALWLKQFHIEAETVKPELRYTLEFLAGGLVSILSRYSYPLKEEELLSCFMQVNGLFSQSAIQFIQSAKEE